MRRELPEGTALEVPPADAVHEMHARLLERYGGPPGIRDAGAVEAALARPQQLMAYGGVTSIPQLAVAIAYSICRIRHPFTDGNKRVAFAVLVVTLDMNGLALDVAETMAAQVIQDVAQGAMPEDAFVRWVAENVVEEGDPTPGPARPA